MEKINKVDEFYKKRTTLEEINRKLKNGYPIYVVNVLEGVEPVKIEISLKDVYQSIDKDHFKAICWRLKRMFEDNVRKELAKLVVNELTEELVKIKDQIKKDFDLEEVK